MLFGILSESNLFCDVALSTVIALVLLSASAEGRISVNNGRDLPPV